jgi:hypothetical protein
MNYISVGGMYELRKGLNTNVYKGLTEDQFTWKKYPKKVVFNNHEMYELKFNLSDVELLGSSDSAEYIPELINRLRILFNVKTVKRDSYEQCKQNSICSQNIAEDDSTIVNYYISNAYSSLSETSMTNDGWEKARMEAEEVLELAKNKSSEAWFDKIDDYYKVQLTII